ncbi:AAA family ATPase [Candidatus Phytoplasma sp. AldY-WA1]|uniref:AAA family ATPase n=1 Tax=Candidatus Phytoplasma sp. AldY-WA1 TaxID=2852100 RepID=UPI00254D9CEE|nr:AAA family ATPase [Candidatus Phytoplasma sp. AldY-WA1]
MPIKKQTTKIETTKPKTSFLKQIKITFIVGFILTILILGIWYCISQSNKTSTTNQPPQVPIQTPTTETQTPVQTSTPSIEKIIGELADKLDTIEEDVNNLKTIKPQPTNNKEINSLIQTQKTHKTEINLLNQTQDNQDEEITSLKKRLSTVELKNIQNPSISQTPTQSNNEDFPKTDLTKMPSFEKLIGFKEEREAADRFLNFINNVEKIPNIGEVSVPTGILLHGVAGTGKTTFAQALAKEVKLPFFNITASQFSKGYLGEAPQMVRDLFATARKEAQKSGGAIIFIDECEEIFKDLTGDQSKAHADTVNIINEFKAQMTSYENDPKKPVFLMGATNHVDKIDEAIRSRFSYMIEIKPGNFEDRKKMLEFLIKKRQNPYSDDAKDYLLNVVNRALDELPPYKRANRMLTGILDEAVSTLVLESNKTTPPRTQINIDDIKTAYRLRVDKNIKLLDFIDDFRKEQQDDTNKPKSQDDANKPKSQDDANKPKSQDDTNKPKSQDDANKQDSSQPAANTQPAASTQATTNTQSGTNPQPAANTQPAASTQAATNTQSGTNPQAATNTQSTETTKTPVTKYHTDKTINQMKEHDQNGKLVKKTCYNNDKITINYIKDYNENQKLIKKTFYKNNKIDSINEYNENKNIIKTTKYDYYSDNQTIHFINEYNENNKLIKKIHYDTNGKTIGCVEEFDENEKLIKQISYWPNSQIINSVYEYGFNNQPIKIILYNSDGIIGSITKFDSDGFVEDIKEFNPDGTIKSQDDSTPQTK